MPYKEFFVHHPILITGAPGWLGTRFIKSLFLGWEGMPMTSEDSTHLDVTAFVYKGQKSSTVHDISDRIKVTEGTLTRKEDCASFVRGGKEGTLIHLAGVIHPRRVREFYEVNLHATQNLIRAAIQAGVRRLVVMSSNSPCGCNPHVDHLFDEESPYCPYMNYGRSKMLMEQFVQSIQREGQMETTIIRSPWFYGPDQPPRQTLFFTMIREGKAPLVGKGNNKRSMAYIDNICQGLQRAAVQDIANGQIYWIADERPYTMNEVINTIEDLLEKDFNIPVKHSRLRLPNVTSELAYFADKVLQAIGLYNQKIHVLSELNKTIACSILKAKKELGYDPSVSLKEGMRQSIQWCIDHSINLRQGTTI